MTGQSWDREGSLSMWRELGGVVHGPVVLAQAAGITVGLRCIFAFPQGLQAWLVAHAAGPALVPRAPSPRSEAEAAELAAAAATAWPGSKDEPIVHAAIDGRPQRMLLLDRRDMTYGRHVSSIVRIDGLPTAGFIDFTVSWGPRLPETTSTLRLPDLDAAIAATVNLVRP